ncbi:hypothetical protein ACH4S8_37980 [Streptomyces sp. NPDC021080]|uniref:hypothetical protein n=1 Tax=Streptomyces sp. NPDC021080 TaxID=3365110 RepID=UPI0037BBBEE4
MTNPTAADRITLRVPATVARLWDNNHADLGAARDALSRDLAAAWDSGTEGARGAWVFTTTRVVAEGFLAILAVNAESEFDADGADTQGARNALRYVASMERQGLEALADTTYRMADPAAQAALEADIARDRTERAAAAERAAEEAPRRAAWNALTRDERRERTATVLDAAGTVLGYQRPAGAQHVEAGRILITVPDGRLHMGAQRMRDKEAAQPALDASRDALAAAGWKITDHGTHFYAQAPQAPAEGPVSVWATTADGERIEFAHIPNGDPARVAAFLADARSAGTFTDVSTQEHAEGPKLTEWERDLVAAPELTVEWTRTVRGHHNGTVTVPDGTAYKIAHVPGGTSADHIAYAHTDEHGIRERVARTWGLTALVAAVAEHAGITGTVTYTETGRERLRPVAARRSR